MQNIVILTGRLGIDVELQIFDNGIDLAKFRMVTWKKWKTEDGEWHERNQWHSIVKWGKGAKYLPERIQKGDMVSVVGEIEYGEYVNKDGNKVYTTTINANTIQKIPAKKENREEKTKQEYSQPESDKDFRAGIGDKDGGDLPANDDLPPF